MRAFARRLGLGLALAALPVPASALLVTCTTSATGVAFGTYAPFNGTPLDSTGTVTVTCTPTLVGLLVSYSIALSAGSSGSYASRTMLSGTSPMNYQLYTDASRSTVWGDGSGGTAVVSDSYTIALLFPVTRNYTVYGRVPALQAVGPGTYSDSIVVTVTY